jgi:hypothetical protein
MCHLLQRTRATKSKAVIQAALRLRDILDARGAQRMERPLGQGLILHTLEKWTGTRQREVEETGQRPARGSPQRTGTPYTAQPLTPACDHRHPDSVGSAQGDTILIQNMQPHLELPAPLSVLGLPQGLGGCWPLQGHPCLQWHLGTLDLRRYRHLW